MRIMPHLDDVGATAGSVIAWQALRAAGVVRTASLMVPCPYYPMARDDVLAEPDQDMGVHVTLTSEWSAYRWRPLTGGAGLRDDEGFFHRRPEAVIARASREEVAEEIAAQIERVLEDGIRPTHLDAHMGTALYDPFIWELIAAGKRYGIPVLGCRDFGPLVDNVRLPGFDPGYLREALAEIEGAGWPVFDRFLIDFCPDGTEADAHYTRLVASGGEGLHFLAMHADTAEGMARFAPHHERPRQKEYALFSDPDSVRVFGGAELVTWADCLRPGQGFLKRNLPRIF